MNTQPKTKWTLTLSNRSLSIPQIVLIAIAITLVMAGCGGLQQPTSSSTTPTQTSVAPPLAITSTTLPTGSLGTAYPQTSLVGNGGVPPYVWTVASAMKTLPPGLALTTNGVISGMPTSVGTSAFTVQLSDSATPTPAATTANFSITVMSATSGTLPPGIVGTAYPSAALNATGGQGPYTWTLASTSSGLPPGLVLSSGAINGTPLAAGTYSFAVQVSDSSAVPNTITMQDLSITISAQGANDSKLNGNYAFLLKGFGPGILAPSTEPTPVGGPPPLDTNGFLVVVGSFVADGNGNISSGTLDLNNSGCHVSPGVCMVTNQLAVTGSYTIRSNNLGTMVLATVFGTSTYTLAMQANGNAKIIQFDDYSNGTRASGVLLKQDTTAFSTSTVIGNYAFGFMGADTYGARSALIGQFQSDGLGNIVNGLADANDNGTIESMSLSGSYSVATNGRGTAMIAGQNSGNTSFTYNCIFYVVSAAELLVMEGYSGGAVLQQSGVGSYTTSSLNSIALLETDATSDFGALSGSTPSIFIGLVTPDGNGDFSISGDQVRSGTVVSASIQGTYSVAPTGRVSLTSSQLQSQPVLYLISQNTAFVLGTDFGVSFGLLEPQSSNTLLDASYTGGSVVPVAAGGPITPTAWISAEVEALEVSSDSITATSDISNHTDNNISGLTQNKTSSVTYSLAANGRGVATQNGNTTAILYVVSPTRFVSIPVGDPDLGWFVVEQ